MAQKYTRTISMSIIPSESFRLPSKGHRLSKAFNSTEVPLSPIYKTQKGTKEDDLPYTKDFANPDPAFTFLERGND
jgi:hypothetical protein